MRPSFPFENQKSKIRNFLALGILALLLLPACATAPPPPDGFAIVAADPSTGQVGVAGAACSETPIDQRAFLVPDKGAGVLLGVNSTLLRDRASAWIEQPLDARTIVKQITDPADDPLATKRQFAVVTFRNGAAVASTSTGTATAPTNNSISDQVFAVATLGSGMVNNTVTSKMSSAFTSSPKTLALSDRLLVALQAASATGGLSLCNNNGVQQSTSTAFILLARHGDPVFKVQTLGGTAPKEPNPPYLALSVTEPIGGPNAIRLLSDQYAAWRSQNLPPCAECSQARPPLPEGGTLTEPADSVLSFYSIWLVAGFVLLVAAITLILLTTRPREKPRHSHHHHTSSLPN